MHPVIRITTFILLAVLLARAHPMQMGWVLCVIGLCFIFEAGKGLAAALKLLWRVRWLLLSIMLIYVWMPVGTITESLWLAAHRMALLVTMLLALQALVLNMARDDIVLGLYMTLFPFTIFGLSREKMVMRLILTLESVAQLPMVIQQDKSATPKSISPLAQISERLVNTISRVLAHGEQIDHAAVTIKTDSQVPLWQWLLPVMISLIFFSLSIYQ